MQCDDVIAPVVDHLASQILLNLSCVCPIKAGQEILLELLHSRIVSTGNEAIIDVSRNHDPAHVLASSRPGPNQVFELNCFDALLSNPLGESNMEGLRQAMNAMQWSDDLVYNLLLVFLTSRWREEKHPVIDSLIIVVPDFAPTNLQLTTAPPSPWILG
jgi:hypothetical protein